MKFHAKAEEEWFSIFISYKKTGLITKVIKPVAITN